MSTGLPRSTCSWFRRSHFGCYTDCSFSDTAGGELCGLASPRASHCRMDRTPNPAAGRPCRIIWFVLGTGSTQRHLPDAFERWAFATDRQRRDLLGRTATERLIGSIKRECLDHVIIIGERHLRHILRSYQQYYNDTRTHLSLAKDSPLTRSVQAVGRILPLPVLGGLHHHYVRI